MLWLRASLFVLASVPMVLANLTGNVTCVPGIGPKHLNDLKFEDLAMPFGVNTLDYYCRILRDVYYCDDYLEEKAPSSNNVVKYLTTARGYLKSLCDPEDYFYQEYKRNEECFAEVLPFYYPCIDVAKDQQEYFPILGTYSKDEACQMEFRHVFCMAKIMRKICGEPDPVLYYLLVQKTTHYFEVYCDFPELLHVRREVGDLMAELFFERKRNREKQSV